MGEFIRENRPPRSDWSTGSAIWTMRSTLAKQEAGIKEASVVTYRRPGEYKSNIYSQLLAVRGAMSLGQPRSDRDVPWRHAAIHVSVDAVTEGEGCMSREREHAGDIAR